MRRLNRSPQNELIFIRDRSPCQVPNQLPPAAPVACGKPLEPAGIMRCPRLLVCIKINKFWYFFIIVFEGFIA